VFILAAWELNRLLSALRWLGIILLYPTPLHPLAPCRLDLLAALLPDRGARVARSGESRCSPPP
jgi:hypothetical protein